MRTLDRFLSRQCWVDFFEGTYFLGRMRRVFGPVDVGEFSAQSMIVGPDARVELQACRDGKAVTLKFHPRRLIPNLCVATNGAKIKSAKVTRADAKKKKV